MFPRLTFLLRFSVILMLVASLTGCSLIRGDGSKQRLDPPPPTPHRPVDSKVKPMTLEVTTDASGAVVTVTIKKGSGSDAIDAYVADSIRGSWPPTPSTRSVVELTYSATRDKRFSDPKIISTSPAP